jgi:hypothetical protein
MSVHYEAEKAMWNDEGPVADSMQVPVWIESDISWQQVCAIVHGGCASGAYMPAVTYHEALATMAEHGDDVLEFIEHYHIWLPKPAAGDSWSGMASLYLSCAVDVWATGASEYYIEAFKQFS